MTLEELYAAAGGNLDEIMGRLRMERIVAMIVVKFLDDTSCADLIAAWEAGDDKAAFHAAHTAKGVCGNLALTRLAELSDQICEALREGNEALRATTDIDALMVDFKAAYAQATDAIAAFAKDQG